MKNVKKSNGMSSNNEGKKKVHFSTAVSKRGVSDLRNDRKDHTIPRDSPLFLHYADRVYLESEMKKIILASLEKPMISIVFQEVFFQNI